MDIITLGNFELLLPDDPDLFVYTRAFQDEELLVICNFSCKKRTFTPPERFNDAQLLLSNEEAAAIQAVDCKALGPFGAVVYSRNFPCLRL